MKTFIPSGAHAVLDYVGGLLITTLPFITGAYRFNSAALFIPLLFGSMQMIMTIFTEHQGGFIKVFPLQLHLALDMLVGFLLIVSPFLYGFYVITWVPYVLLGLLSFSAALFTRRSPFIDRVELFDEQGE
jgi:hypothetical protein